MPTDTLTKNIDIDWLKGIPSDWNLCSLKYVTSILTCGYASTPDYYEEGIPFLSAQNIQNEKISLDKYNFISESLHKSLTKYKKVKKDDILQVRVGATIGKSAIVNLDFEFSIYVSLSHIRINKKANNRYINYIISSDKFLNQVCLDVDFIGCQGNLNVADLKQAKIPLPSLNEQRAIADFLDNKCEKIDKVIGEIEEQVQILEDYKKSLITETVTKGLDKTVPMKDSGIDWIGEIPKNWNIKRIKYFTTLNGRIGWQGLTTEDYKEEGPFLITGTDFLNGKINWDTCTHITEKRWIEANTIQIRDNDLLITKDGTVGKIAIVEDLKDKASLNSGVLLIRPNGNVKYNNKYIYYQLLSDVFWSWFEFNKSGNSTIIHLYQQDFENLYVLLPDIQEQEQISNYLDKKCAEIDYLIKNKKEQLETIKEYKKSLIYEYVTGKKRVAF